MDYKNIFENFKHNSILIIGDIMLDTYLIGHVDRISPESPFPVVDIDNKMDKLGGAANVALNIRELGATPIICSIIGEDFVGIELQELMKKQNINTEYLYKSSKRKTTNKTRIIGNKTQMLRIDNESRENIDEKDNNGILYNVMKSLDENSIDAIILQDYDKGVINKELLDTLNEMQLNIPIYVDPKLKNFSFYKNVRFFKPNFNELKRGLKNEFFSMLKFDEIYLDVEKMMKRQKIDIFYTTMGELGILISYIEDGKILHRHIQGEKRSVADVSGAGDTVISVAVLLDINGVDKLETARISNIAGGLVCEKLGVVPINKDDLLNQI